MKLKTVFTVCVVLELASHHAVAFENTFTRYRSGFDLSRMFTSLFPVLLDSDMRASSFSEFYQASECQKLQKPGSIGSQDALFATAGVPTAINGEPASSKPTAQFLLWYSACVRKMLILDLAYIKSEKLPLSSRLHRLFNAWIPESVLLSSSEKARLEVKQRELDRAYTDAMSKYSNDVIRLTTEHQALLKEVQQRNRKKKRREPKDALPELVLPNEPARIVATPNMLASLTPQAVLDITQQTTFASLSENQQTEFVRFIIENWIGLGILTEKSNLERKLMTVVRKQSNRSLLDTAKSLIHLVLTSEEFLTY